MTRKNRLTFSTETHIKSVIFEPSGSTAILHDSVVNGLKVYVNKSSKTYRVSRYFKGKDHNIKLGQFPALPLHAARTEAMRILSEIESGEYGRGEYKRLTLAEGWAIAQEQWAYVDPDTGEQAARANTVHFYESFWRLHLEPHFGKMNMVELSEDPETFRRWYLKKMKTSGASTADACLRTMSAIYAKVRERYDMLPMTPTRTCPKRKEFIAEYDLGRDALAQHFAELSRCPDPVKVALFDWLYLTGMRVNSVREMRWSMLEGDNSGFVVPAEFMKARRPFFLPLTPCLQEVLDRVRPFSRGNDGYVFSSPVTGGRIGRYEFAEAWTCRRLRKHFGTEAYTVALPHLIETLMAHSLNQIPGASAVTHVYIRPTREQLKDAMTTITAHLSSIKREVSA